MFKKYISYLGVLVFVFFSFFYTDKAVDIIKRNDPIMKTIISKAKLYVVEPMSAIVNDDEIISGINGKKVDINKSYERMKKINSFNESMLVFDEVIPNITIKNQYDKYIVSGNNIENKISLVFKVYDSYYLEKVNQILLDKNVVATFFIDGSVVEDNMNLILELVKNDNEIENLGYEKKYAYEKFNWTNNMIRSLTNKDTKYCYSDYKNDEVLKICGLNMMYTIKPNLSVSNYPFSTIKNNLSNGSIISLNLNENVIRELPIIITYIKQKGKKIVLLEDLVSENIVSDE